MFCANCGQPEASRRDGAPGHVWITFICGTQIEADEMGGWFRGSTRGLPITCIVLGNANPHSIARRLDDIEKKLNAEPSLRIDYERPSYANAGTRRGDD